MLSQATINQMTSVGLQAQRHLDAHLPFIETHLRMLDARPFAAEVRTATLHVADIEQALKAAAGVLHSSVAARLDPFSQGIADALAKRQRDARIDQLELSVDHLETWLDSFSDAPTDIICEILDARGILKRAKPVIASRLYSRLNDLLDHAYRARMQVETASYKGNECFRLLREIIAELRAAS